MIALFAFVTSINSKRSNTKISDTVTNNTFKKSIIWEYYLTRSCAVPDAWHTKQIWISFVSFEFEATGVDVDRALTFSGLTKPDERRVRTGGLFDDMI